MVLSQASGQRIKRRRRLLPGAAAVAVCAVGLLWSVAAGPVEVATSRPADDAFDLRAAYVQPPEKWPAANWLPQVPVEERRELGLLPEVEHPAENPFNEAKEELGKKLFYDPRLSGSGHVSCVSCHHPDQAWADGRRVSFGHALVEGERNAPSLMNIGHARTFMWDGRAASLEDQVILPLTDGAEMAADPAVVIERLKEAGYGPLFAEAFDGDDTVSLQRVAQALACFQRTIVGGRSDFDKFLSGHHDALTDEQLRGLHLFRTSANCINCHSGPTFSDNQFHDLGLSYYGRKYEDLGRYEITKQPEDVGKFRTPTLRNVTRTFPYMHIGLFDLEGVIRMYDAGMATLRPKEHQLDDPLFPTKSDRLHPLNLSEADRQALMAFLKALEEPRRTIRPPELPGR